MRRAVTSQKGAGNLLDVTAAAAESFSLGEMAYQRLREDIITCRLPPGHHLTERKLAAETGFGVSPIREALTRLDHDQLVITLPRRGYQVARLTIRSVDDLFQFWGFVGPEVARRGVEAATPAQTKEVLNALDALKKLGKKSTHDRKESLEALDHAGKMFQTFAEATDNSYFAAVVDKLTLEMARVWFLILDADSSDFAIAVPAAALARIVEGHDGEAAAAAAREFIQESHDKVLRVLARWPSVMASEVVPLRDNA